MLISLFYSSIILIGIAVFILANTIFIDEGQYKASEKLEDQTGKSQKNDHGVILKYSRPFFRRYVVPAVSSMKFSKKIKVKYKQKLASAGLNYFLTPEDFYSFKVFLILGFPLVFMVLKYFLEADWPLAYVPIIATIGYFYPDLWIRSVIAKRQAAIIRHMPFCVDMLALCVEAGLDFVAAMGKVVQKAKPSPMTEEFDTLMKEIVIGASRSEALRNLSWRVNLINISSFCATLIAADSVGANIGPILKALSNEIRQKKSSDIEKAAATASTKILFPTIFLIVPSVLVIMAAPLALEFMRNQ